jgi:hypothetical protein
MTVTNSVKTSLRAVKLHQFDAELPWSSRHILSSSLECSGWLQYLHFVFICIHLQIQRFRKHIINALAHSPMNTLAHRSLTPSSVVLTLVVLPSTRVLFLNAVVLTLSENTKIHAVGLLRSVGQLFA